MDNAWFSRTSVRDFGFAVCLGVAINLVGCGGDGNDIDESTCNAFVDCVTPPAATCSDGTQITYAAVGSCTAAGACYYPETRLTCSIGCDGVSCATCDPSECVTPPAPVCERDTAVTWASPGTCSATGCEYEITRQECSFKCQDGVCLDDPCSGVTCNQPPAALCRDNTAVTYEAGVCSDGECTYEEATVDCTNSGSFCDAGACVALDPCADVVCDQVPDPICDGFIRRVFRDGECNRTTGECEYPDSRRNCAELDQICEDGACVDGDPCELVVCGDPPPGRCDEDTAISYAVDGICEAAICSYPESRQNCADTGEFCVDGACVDVDPCDGVVCNDSPGDTCVGNQAASFSPIGECRRGECIYEAAYIDCFALGQFCQSGECVLRNPCEGVECLSPPVARCDDSIALSYAPTGTCDLGSCSYEELADDCSARGLFCAAGTCVDSDPCEGIECAEIPADACDGDVAVDYTGASSCTSGECSYGSNRVNCAIRGGRCENAVCVFPDPCDSVTCDAPPAAQCDGRTAVAYGAGSCADGLCSYERIENDCTELPSGYCFQGECFSADPCFGVVCDTPRAPTCDGYELLTYQSPGTCDAGGCEYSATRFDCTTIPGGYCQDGACRSTDPCFGVTCETPAAPTCDADELVTYALPGECVDGGCDYAETRRDCGIDPRGFCYQGACRSLDLCFEVDCSEAPAAFCDGSQRVIPQADGNCVSGECFYSEVREACADSGQTCVAGQCVDFDPCTRVTCNTPPPNACAGTEVVYYESNGTCSDGVCDYREIRDDCGALGGACVDGACVTGDPCVGVICNSNPPPICEGNNQIRFSSPSACLSGECRYTRQRIACDNVRGGTCQGGACVVVDGCAGVTCGPAPEPSCDNRTAITYSGAGSCVFGECEYTETRTDCAASNGYCFEGACVPVDPCADVSCNAPQADSCDGSVATRYSSAGVCLDGSCEYPSVRFDCADSGEVCENGRCVSPDLCGGSQCNEPPAPTCEGGAAYTFSRFGECVDGGCEYEATVDDCAARGAFCAAGACVAVDPCVGVTCRQAPQFFCEDGVAIAEDVDGVCIDGECNYSTTTDDCGARGEFCLNGSCQASDPCEGVVCEPPPPATCRGDVVVVAAAGICADGDCVYPETTTDCAARGLACDLGACVTPDPCDNVMCPIPAAYCEGRVAVSPTAAECIDGDCAVTASRVDCSTTGDFCEFGVCVDADPCTGVVCNEAPAAFCFGNQATSFAASGTCNSGGCVYPSTTENCALSGELCFDGVCSTVDPCAGVTCNTPPGPMCEGDQLVLSSAPGSCAGGSCFYQETRTTCGDDNFCEGSVLHFNVSSSCAGTACATTSDELDCSSFGAECTGGQCVGECGACSPVAATCNGNIAQQPSGFSCASGTCQSVITDVNCSATGRFCVDGACVATNPCAGVTCNTLPPPECSGTTIQREYLTAGFCEGGVCQYLGTDTDCSETNEVCVAGACVAATCLNVTCDSPPQSFCSDGVAYQYPTTGTCAAGVCSYPETQTDCTSEGEFCFAGACTPFDFCASAGCVADEIIAARCDEAGLVIETVETGACSDGVCETTEQFGFCGPGLTCTEGQCL